MNRFEKWIVDKITFGRAYASGNKTSFCCIIFTSIISFVVGLLFLYIAKCVEI